MNLMRKVDGWGGHTDDEDFVGDLLRAEAVDGPAREQSRIVEQHLSDAQSVIGRLVPLPARFDTVPILTNRYQYVSVGITINGYQWVAIGISG